ncbi:stage 0 sporulation regulatory protein [Lysinibacillus composti]|nr:aspartyl-phosphate phosphatase Spo0E family protein [Lysinibacillus composti]MBM7607875.1 stage 0 sporulation regulatory protein [Lysinibacillus composti]
MQDILKELEDTRELMIQSGMKNGLQNPKTIRLSRQLDELMNRYEKEIISSQYNIKTRKYLQ